MYEREAGAARCDSSTCDRLDDDEQVGADGHTHGRRDDSKDPTAMWLTAFCFPTIAKRAVQRLPGCLFNQASKEF